MKIVTIVENNPITGVRYGVAEVPEYNNNTQRRINRYNRLRNQQNMRTIKTHRTHSK